MRRIAGGKTRISRKEEENIDKERISRKGIKEGYQGRKDKGRKDKKKDGKPPLFPILFYFLPFLPSFIFPSFSSPSFYMYYIYIIYVLYMYIYIYGGNNPCRRTPIYTYSNISIYLPAWLFLFPSSFNGLLLFLPSFLSFLPSFLPSFLYGFPSFRLSVLHPFRSSFFFSCQSSI